MSETHNENDHVYKADDVVKDTYANVKAFIKRHPTLSTSVITGVISWKMSKRHTLKKVSEEVSELAYRWGNEAGMLEMQRNILLDFIHANDLKDQAMEFVSDLR